ncbi:prepilin-type N-terminal cleavage/methylation domain-containing protein [bacterium]|nr:prepilin-type N-terminal cleavage/methylation domain-containing protein [bacterium]
MGFFTPRNRAFSLLEVLVAVVILITGITAIAAFFPMALRQNQNSIDKSNAAFLAQMKAEEIRRDDTRGALLIQAVTVHEPPGEATERIVFAQDERFAYSFGNRSEIDPEPVDSSDLTTTHGIPRIIVRYAADFKPTEDVLYELRFGFR